MSYLQLAAVALAFVSALLMFCISVIEGNRTVTTPGPWYWIGIMAFAVATMLWRCC